MFEGLRALPTRSSSISNWFVRPAFMVVFGIAFVFLFKKYYATYNAAASSIYGPGCPSSAS